MHSLHTHEFSEDRFFRRARRISSFHKGDLKYLLLYLLKDKPKHGYDIIREIEDRSYGFYKPSPGVIYPTLQMLEEMGFATSNEDNGKKVYAISQEGRKFLENKKDIANDLRGHIKNDWKFKNIDKKAKILDACHNLKDMLHDNIRKVDDAKTEKVIEIIKQAYRDIENIIEE